MSWETLVRKCLPAVVVEGVVVASLMRCIFRKLFLHFFECRIHPSVPYMKHPNTPDLIP